VIVLKNIPIIGKFLSILAIFGVFAVASAVYSTRQMSDINASYVATYQGPVAAYNDLSHANRMLVSVRDDVAETLIDATAAGSAASSALITSEMADFNASMTKAATLAPDYSGQIAAAKGIADNLVGVSCARSIQLGRSAVTPPEVLASQQEFLANCAGNFPPVVLTVKALQNQLIAADNQSVAAQTAKSGQAVLITFGAIIVGLLAVLGIGYFGITAWLVKPVKALQGTMDRLSGGDMQAEVAGTDRKDEIGRMSRAVRVFKESGLEKIRLEEEAEAARNVAAAERNAAASASEAAAARQAFVVESIAKGLETLAKGDLVFRLEKPFSGGYDGLRTDFNKAMGSLQDTMQAIGANTQAVRSGAEEITQASDDLSRRTEQQAASLEQTAAALDQITATVRKTAEGATEARNVVAAAKGDAERSGNVVKETITAMSGIESSSKQISNIIGVIDEIAFQTNLLALNAGVEAARAGDAGRGFAVVATEVRALAQRSADAAREIKTLISASGAQVASGVALVDETGKALARTVEQVEQLNRLVSDIAASAQEQATGLHQVNTAVNQMDQVTQQNAAMVEQATAASHSLAGEAEELARLVGQFRTGSMEATTAPVKSRIPVHAPV